MNKEARVQQVVIDVPRHGLEPWVSLAVQYIYYDEQGEAVQVVDRATQVHTGIYSVAGDVVTYFDPVLQENKTISAAGCGEAIKHLVAKWTTDELNGTLAEDGKTIFLEK